jgi:hypothetical protein
MQRYNLFQRDGNHQRLDFYSKELCKVVFPEALRLPLPPQELRLMTASFKVRRQERERHVVYWSVNRRFSLMAFDDSYRAIRDETDIEIVKKTVYGGAEATSRA